MEYCNDLRGSVDGWDFKQYVLGCFFTDTYLKSRRLYQRREQEAGDTELIMQNCQMRSRASTRGSCRYKGFFTCQASFLKMSGSCKGR
jgi:type I restriction-modification system DNA methylase subunit